MSIPEYRIASSKPLEKEKKRNRRKHAKLKDQHKRPARGTVARRYVELEKIMKKEWRKDYE